MQEGEEDENGAFLNVCSTSIVVSYCQGGGSSFLVSLDVSTWRRLGSDEEELTERCRQCVQ